MQPTDPRADSKRYEHILRMHPYYTRENIDAGMKADAISAQAHGNGGEAKEPIAREGGKG